MYTSHRLDLLPARAAAAPPRHARPAPAPAARPSEVPQATGLELRRHLAVLRRRARLVAVTTLLCAGVAGAASLTSTPTYAATTDLFVSAQAGGSDASNAYQGGLLSQQRVQSYAKLVTSSAVAEAVVDKLYLTESAEALRARIHAQAPVNTVLITVSVTDEDPRTAKRLVDAVAEEFRRLAARLEAPAGRAGTPPVQVRVVQPAQVPTDPVSPDVPRTTALGIVLGLLLGVGLAFLRDVLDSSVKSVEDVEQHLRATPLGVIAHDGESASRPLIVADAPHSTRSEAFRHLRTNLQFVDVDRAPRSIIVTSSLAGEGKSTTTCNLAISLAQSGLQVCVVDADLRRPRVAQYFGLEGAVGLTDVLIGNAQLDDVLQQWGSDGLSVLPAGPVPPNPAELLGSAELAQLLATLSARFDLVLIDSPPVLPVTDSNVLSTVVDGALVVVRTGRTTRDQARRCLQSLQSVGGRVYGVVLVGVDAGARGRDGYGYGYGYGYGPQGEPQPEDRRWWRREGWA